MRAGEALLNAQVVEGSGEELGGHGATIAGIDGELGGILDVICLII